MPFRIVVADPSPSVQKAVQMAFLEPDFKLYFFDDSAGLIESLPQIRPDTILLALSLAGRNALEIGRFLSNEEDFRRIPLFLLKGTFENFDAEEAGPLVYDGVVQKPFDSERLKAIVVEAIDKKISPPTLPEEPVPEEIYPQSADLEDRNIRPPLTKGIPDDLRLGIRELVKEEVFEMERELEKRIKARVLSELGKRPAADNKEPLS